MRFLKITAVATIILIPLTLILEKLENSEPHTTVTAVMSLFIMPGFIIYVIVTGDIHGWKPGPIGVGGRITVTVLASALFWSTLIYFASRKRYRKD